MQKITDATQAIVWDGQFTPYGRTHAIAGTVQNPLRFPGQWADPAAAYFYNYMRDYDPTLAQYLSGDPLTEEVGPNRYSYASSNPQNLTDPTGEQSESADRLTRTLLLPTPLSPLAYGGEALRQVNRRIFCRDTNQNRALGELYSLLSVAAPQGGVYGLFVKGTSILRYVGRTKDLDRRRQEQLRNPRFGQLQFREIYKSNSPEVQRGLEQRIFERRGPELNRINPVSPQNPNYGRYLGAAVRFLGRRR